MAASTGITLPQITVIIKQDSGCWKSGQTFITASVIVIQSVQRTIFHWAAFPFNDKNLKIYEGREEGSAEWPQLVAIFSGS